MIKAEEAKKIKESFFSKLHFLFLMFLIDKRIKRQAKRGAIYIHTGKTFLLNIFLTEYKIDIVANTLMALGYKVSAEKITFYKQNTNKVKIKICLKVEW